MKNVYAIPDLHGRFDLLCKAISLIEKDAGEEGGTMISLGDFVDRGPNPRGIIELFMQGPSVPNWEWIVLQGNHEMIMLKGLAKPRKNLKWWVRNGGGSTLKSYGYVNGDEIFPLRVPQEHIDWLSKLPVVVEYDKQIYVHAGVPYDSPVWNTPIDTMQWMLYPGDIPGLDAEFHEDLPHISGKHIVHGHHQSPSHPLLKEHRTNLDAMAWFTGRLAIGVFNDSQPGPIKILYVQGMEALS